MESLELIKTRVNSIATNKIMETYFLIILVFILCWVIKKSPEKGFFSFQDIFSIATGFNKDGELKSILALAKTQRQFWP